MNENITPIKHSEIFFSVESFLDFFAPKDVEGKSTKKCRPYSLPFWHPLSIKGQGIISGAELLEDGRVSLFLTFAANKSIPFEVSLANNWLMGENYIDSFEKVAAYFVNGTCFGKEGGSYIVIDGPKKFEWVYEEPEFPICEECGAKNKEE